VDFAAAQGLGGRVANALDFGGYLLWTSPKSMRVLVDGRRDLAYDPAFVRRALQSEHDSTIFSAMRAEDGITWALASNAPGQTGDAFLARDPSWALVYWSEPAAVYVRREAHSDLSSLMYRYVDPSNVPLSIARAVAQSRGDTSILGGILGEVRRMLDASPDSLRANVALLALLDGLGPARRRERDALLDNLLLLTRDEPDMGAIVRSFER
jgi:hypothetical protein